MSKMWVVEEHGDVDGPTFIAACDELDEALAAVPGDVVYAHLHADGDVSMAVEARWSHPFWTVTAMVSFPGWTLDEEN